MKPLIEKNRFRTDVNFNWRGTDVSRLEGFSDAVFAFAITLLVVSLEVPSNYDELIRAMGGFISFAISFTMLIFLWYYHYLFFRRYNLQTYPVIILNAILLFVILFYIYPLKFLFNYLTDGIFGISALEESISITKYQSSNIMLIYSSGLLIIFVVYTLMYIHAYLKRDLLKLNPMEILFTKVAYEAHMIYASVAVLSIILALTLDQAAYAGIIYGLFGPARGVHGISINKRFNKINKTKNNRSQDD